MSFTKDIIKTRRSIIQKSLTRQLNKQETDTYYLLINEVNNLCDNININKTELIIIANMLGIDQLYTINMDMTKDRICKILKNWLLMEYDEYKGVTYKYPLISPSFKDNYFISQFELELPKIDLTSFGTDFKGYNIYMLIFLTYLMNEYSYLCVPYVQTEFLGISWHVLNPQYTEQSRIISFFYPNKIVFPKDFKEIMSICINDPKTLIVAIPIQLEGKDFDFNNKKFVIYKHLNILLYYKNTQILERYEPHLIHGLSDIYGSDKLDKEIISGFKKMKIPLKEIITPILICPKSNIGLQTLQEQENITLTNYPPDFTGFCMVWSLWFIHLKLEYPYISSNELLDYAIHKFQKDKIVLTHFIAGYSNWIILFKEEMMKNISDTSNKNIETNAYNTLVKTFINKYTYHFNNELQN